MQDVYKNIEEYNPSRKCNVSIVFDNMTVDTSSNKKRSPIVTELFIRGGKLNISTVFITKYFFKFPENVTLNWKFFFIKIPKKWKLLQITFNRSSYIELTDFLNQYKKFTTKPYSVLVIDTTFVSDNSLRFTRDLLAYHQVKLTNMNILQVKKYYLPIKVKLPYSPLVKVFEKQINKEKQLKTKEKSK